MWKGKAEGQGYNNMSEKHQMDVSFFEVGSWSWDRKRKQILGAVRGKKMRSSLKLQKEYSPGDALMFAQWQPSQIYNFQNGKMLHYTLGAFTNNITE